MPRTTDPGLSIQQLQTLMRKRETEIAHLERRRDAIARRLDALDRRINDLRGGAPASTGLPRIRAKNTKSLAAVMEEVLQKAGKPLPVGEIVEAVRGSGYRSNAANFRAIVNQMLIKDGRFSSPKRTFYQLKK